MSSVEVNPLDITDGDLAYLDNLREMAKVADLDCYEASRYRVAGPMDVNWIELDFDWQTADWWGWNAYSGEKERLGILSFPEALAKMRVFNEHINKCYASGLSIHDYPIHDMLFVRNEDIER